MRFLVRMAVLNVVAVPTMVFAPLLFLASPWLPRSPICYVLFVVGPFSCAFWTMIAGFWQGKRMPFIQQVVKSLTLVFFGMIGSFAAELAFVFVASPRVPVFALGFASYLPTILVVVWRLR